MKTVIRIIITVAATVVLTGCTEKGYKQIDGLWYWVKWDEGGGQKILLQDVDISSFRVIDGELALDKDSVWDSGAVHFPVNTANVEFLGRSWVKDEKKVFQRNGQPGEVPGLNAKEFKEIHPKVFSDGKRFFIDSQEVGLDEAQIFMTSPKATPRPKTPRLPPPGPVFAPATSSLTPEATSANVEKVK